MLNSRATAKAASHYGAGSTKIVWLDKFFLKNGGRRGYKFKKMFSKLVKLSDN
jgi:hypothetical protein